MRSARNGRLLQQLNDYSAWFRGGPTVVRVRRSCLAWLVETVDARDLIADQLRQDGFAVQDGAVSDTEALIGRRAQWLMTAKLHEFVFVFVTEGLSGERAEQLTGAAQSFAIKHKGGLPRGLQTGTLTIAAFLDPSPQDSAVAWVDQSPVHRFSALRFSVLVDTTDEETVYWDGAWTVGSAFTRETLALVRGLVVKPLRSLSSGGTKSLPRRVSPGSEESKTASAQLAKQSFFRSLGKIMAPVLTIPLAVIFYFLFGVGGAVLGLFLGGLATGGGIWVASRYEPKPPQALP